MQMPVVGGSFRGFSREVTMMLARCIECVAFLWLQRYGPDLVLVCQVL